MVQFFLPQVETERASRAFVEGVCEPDITMLIKNQIIGYVKLFSLKLIGQNRSGAVGFIAYNSACATFTSANAILVIHCQSIGIVGVV